HLHLRGRGGSARAAQAGDGFARRFSRLESQSQLAGVRRRKGQRKVRARERLCAGRAEPRNRDKALTGGCPIGCMGKEASAKRRKIGSARLLGENCKRRSPAPDFGVALARPSRY